jgi:hypothetical protein
MNTLAAIALTAWAAASSTANGSAPVKDLGRGLKPQRGTVEMVLYDGRNNFAVPPGDRTIEFEPAEMNFGVLAPGDAARGTSRIWNVGLEPVRIVKSITSCGCTAADDLGGRVIPPGGYTEFSTTMSMKSGLGEKKEKITVYFEGSPQPIAIQYYTAEVSLPVRVTPSAIARELVNGQWTQTTSGQVRLTAVDGKPFRVLRSQGGPPAFVGFDPARDAPRSEYVVRWDLAPFGTAIPWFWVFETDRDDCPVIDARIQHMSTKPLTVPGRPWQPKDQRLLVGRVRRGEAFEIVTRIEYGGRNLPQTETATISSWNPALRAELLDAPAEGRELAYRIRLTPTADLKPGLLYAQLNIKASGFEVPLFVIGTVE